MRLIGWITVATIIMAFWTCGCTPQSVKKSGALAVQAVAYAKSEAEEVAMLVPEQKGDRLIKALSDTERLLRPVMLCIGRPNYVEIYDPDGDVSALASQAEMEQRIANAVQNKLIRFAEVILPGKLKELLPEPKEEGVNMNDLIQYALAALVGSGAMYGGAKTGKRILEKRKAG